MRWSSEPRPARLVTEAELEHFLAGDHPLLKAFDALADDAGWAGSPPPAVEDRIRAAARAALEARVVVGDSPAASPTGGRSAPLSGDSHIPGHGALPTPPWSGLARPALAAPGRAPVVGAPSAKTPGMASPMNPGGGVPGQPPPARVSTPPPTAVLPPQAMAAPARRRRPDGYAGRRLAAGVVVGLGAGMIALLGLDRYDLLHPPRAGGEGAASMAAERAADMALTPNAAPGVEDAATASPPPPSASATKASEAASAPRPAPAAAPLPAPKPPMPIAAQATPAARQRTAADDISAAAGNGPPASERRGAATRATEEPPPRPIPAPFPAMPASTGASAKAPSLPAAPPAPLAHPAAPRSSPLTAVPGRSRAASSEVFFQTPPPVAPSRSRSRPAPFGSLAAASPAIAAPKPEVDNVYFDETRPPESQDGASPADPIAGMREETFARVRRLIAKGRPDDAARVLEDWISARRGAGGLPDDLARFRRQRAAEAARRAGSVDPDEER